MLTFDGVTELAEYILEIPGENPRIFTCELNWYVDNLCSRLNKVLTEQCCMRRVERVVLHSYTKPPFPNTVHLRPVGLIDLISKTGYP